jgi:hypothetical protein
MTTLDDCTIIQLPKMASTKGNLTPVYALEHVPFEIERVYYIYDVPGGESRGAHAHRELRQFFVALMGGFEVVLDDGSTRKKFLLNRAYYGLYVPRLIWRELINFSSGGICLVMASLPYDPSDYIRDYEEFLRIKQRDR